MPINKREGEEFEESDDGAVDVVFLLIIFFLVTSSFTTEIKEKMALPPKPEDKTQTPPPTKPPEDPKPIMQLKIVVFEDNVVWMNKTPVEFFDETASDEASIELYYNIVERINSMRLDGVRAAEAGFLELEEDGFPPMNIKLWSDKRANAGMTFHALMACLDARKTPEIKFDEELNPDEILAEPTLENPAGID